MILPLPWSQKTTPMCSAGYSEIPQRRKSVSVATSAMLFFVPLYTSFKSLSSTTKRWSLPASTTLLSQLLAPPVCTTKRTLSLAFASSISCRSPVAIPFSDSRSAPQRYTKMVQVPSAPMLLLPKGLLVIVISPVVRLTCSLVDAPSRFRTAPAEPPPSAPLPPSSEPAPPSSSTASASSSSPQAPKRPVHILNVSNKATHLFFMNTPPDHFFQQQDYYIVEKAPLSIHKLIQKSSRGLAGRISLA